MDMTPEYITAYMIAHYRIDMKAKEIAEHLGVSEDAVSKIAYRLREKGLMEKRPNKLGTVRNLPIGSEKTMTLPDGRTQTYKKTEEGWRYKAAGVKKGRPAKKKQKEGEVANTITRTEKAPQIAKEVARLRYIPNTERSPIDKTTIVRTDRNPESFTVKQETGKLVPVTGYPVKTWKYRKQDAA